MKKDNTPYALEYLKSALSINTHVGCMLGCEYCVVDEFAPGGIERIYSPGEAIETLLGNRLFILGITPITLNNRTDPLLPAVKSYTMEMVRLLNEKGVRNPRAIVSKLGLELEDLDLLEDSCAETYFFVTYSNLPKSVEKVPHALQRKTLEVLSRREKVHAVHYWRPLIKGLNDSIECLEEVLMNVIPICEGSVLSGLRLDANIHQKITRLGGDVSGWCGDTKHKYLPGEIVDKILKLRAEMTPEYPLYRHTSCPISASQHKMDYNFHFLKKDNCLVGCPNRDNCSLPTRPRKEDIDLAFARLRLKREWCFGGDHLMVKGSISEEERSSLAHQINFPVNVEQLTKTPSEEILRK